MFYVIIHNDAQRKNDFTIKYVFFYIDYIIKALYNQVKNNYF